MARLNISFNLKNKIMNAVSEPQSEDGIHSAIGEITNSSDKIYAARFLDKLIKDLRKTYDHITIKGPTWNATALIQKLNSNINMGKIYASLHASLW